MAKEKNNTNKYLIIAAVFLILIAIVTLMNLEKITGIETPLTSRTLATVNGQEITENELNQRIDFLFFSMGYPQEYKSMIDMNAFLENMADETLLLQEARKNNVPLEKREIEEAIEELLFMMNTNKQELESELIEAGFSMNYLQEYYAKQILIGKLLNEKVLNEISVEEKEINDFYQNNLEIYEAREGEIRARHILVNEEEKIKEIYEELMSTSIAMRKERFIELAKEKSTCPSGMQGGDLGFFGKGMMVPEFEEEAFKLSVNEISKPVKTQFGWHIIMRDERRLYLSEVKEEIKAELLSKKQNEVLMNYITQIRERSEIEIKKITEAEVIQEIGMPTITGAACYEKYEIKEESVVFYYTNSCPFCLDMIPIVKELEKEGYKFFWADAATANAQPVRECFADVIQGGVPQFICSGTKEYLMGRVSKERLKEFAEICKS